MTGPISNLSFRHIAEKCRQFGKRGLTPIEIVRRMDELYEVSVSIAKVRKYLAISPAEKRVAARNRMRNKGFVWQRFWVHPDDSAAVSRVVRRLMHRRVKGG